MINAEGSQFELFGAGSGADVAGFWVSVRLNTAPPPALSSTQAPLKLPENDAVLSKSTRIESGRPGRSR
jgi:hypothetical protein